MGYIYVITNLLNSKKYVGKTTTTIKERWQEHCADSKKPRCNRRPLYNAFAKYGIENFRIEELEYVEDNNQLDSKEIYWIQELQTYGCTGYNATKRGDGKVLYDHREIIELYQLGYSVAKVSRKIGCDITTVIKVLKANGVALRNGWNMVDQFDLAGNYIQTFDSINSAVEWLIEQGLTRSKAAGKNIIKCCNKHRAHAHGYKWVYKNIPE
jgi:hypothetical protein